MTDIERIRQICREKNIPIATLERDLGFSNGSLNPKYQSIASNRLPLIANYLHVPVERLLGMEESNVVIFPGTDSVSSRYARLNDQGQLMAADYLDFLITRYPAFPDLEEQEDENGTIRRYLHAPAAGYSSPVFDEDYIEIPRTKGVPKNADYCLNVRGDSMEPYIHDGQLVYVQRTTLLDDGDVGIWYWHGDTYCKQVVVDARRTTYLLSANPDREDANITIRYEDAGQLRCLGKVLLPKRLPMPEYN